MIQSVKSIGSFDPKTPNLFFRHQIFSFPGFAKLFGRMGNFYSGYKFNKEDKSNFKKFLNSCQEISKGKIWSEFSEEDEECKNSFFQAVSTYYKRTSHLTLEGLSKQPGGKVLSIPSTSIMKDSAVKNFNDFDRQYGQTIDPNFGNSFKVSFDDIKFGYWGSPKLLDKINLNLKKNYSSDMKLSLIHI